MGCFLQDVDGPHFDYGLQALDAWPGQIVRGPLPDLQKPYFVCLGSAQTFGRFCHEPFPLALSRALDLPVLNLGLSGAGPKVFLDDNALALVNGAVFVIIEVMSGNTEGNSEFDSKGFDGLAGIRKSDGRSMTFNEFLAEKLAQSQQALVARVVEEGRENWVERYRALLTQISVPKILHWFSTSSPRRTDDYSDVWKLLGPYPQLVNRRMISRIVPFADTYIQTIRNTGLPQVLWNAEQGIDGASVFEGTLLNNYYPSPEMHAAATADLLPVCKVLASASHAASRSEPDVVIIAANAHEGMILADLCGPGATMVSYRQLLEDRGLLPFVAARKPRFLHLRRRNLLSGYLADRRASLPNSKFAQSGYVHPIDFATYAHSTAKAERLIAVACKGTELVVEYFEDLVEDGDKFVARITDRFALPGLSETSLAIALERRPAEQQAENLGELSYLYTRMLKDVQKSGE